MTSKQFGRLLGVFLQALVIAAGLWVVMVLVAA